MKFNTIIANPPYKGTLHVEFDNFVLKNCLNDGGHFVSISPVGQFTDCSFVDRAAKAVDREFIANEKYVRNIEIVETHTANKSFGITLDSELGIKHFHKTPVYSGAWRTILENSRREILPVYEKVVKTFKEKGYKSLIDMYDRTVMPKDKKSIVADVEGKIYVKVTGAMGGGQFSDNGVTPAYRWMSIISHDVEKRQNSRKPEHDKGGYIILATEYEREKTLWRLLGKDCWLMRACCKTVKRDRNLKPEYIPFIPPSDERTDDEIAIQDFGMTPEEIQTVKDWMNPYISQHDYKRP